MAGTDSGVVSVNMDDAILSGKVLFDNRESILLLTPTHIICREFAGHRDSTAQGAARGRALSRGLTKRVARRFAACVGRRQRSCWRWTGCCT